MMWAGFSSVTCLDKMLSIKATTNLFVPSCEKNSLFILTLSLLVVTCLLITFANSLDLDQDRQNVGPDLDPNLLTL